MMKLFRTLIPAILLANGLTYAMEPIEYQKQRLSAQLYEIVCETDWSSGAEEQAIQAIQKLIDAGADINWRSMLGETAFLCAVERSRLLFCKFLLAHGAKLTPEGDEDEFALRLAAAQSRPISELVIEAMLQSQLPNQVNRLEKGMRVYKIVASLEEQDPFSFNTKNHLLDKYFPSLTRWDKKSALMKMAARGDIGLEFCKWLIEVKKVNIHQVTGSGITALHEAARSGSKGVCELLVTHGAGVFCMESNGLTALDFASESEPVYGLTEKARYRETCEFLIEKMIERSAQLEDVLCIVNKLKNDTLKQHLLEKYFPNQQ